MRKGTTRDILSVRATRPRSCKYVILSFFLVFLLPYESPSFSLRFDYVIHVLKIKLFNNKKKSHGRLTCTNIRTACI